ncbi:unnamed protein product [Agarophyton chilense]|eukprot:gb/GEZJ01004520.1/.p1 GENE.gb/GEZJ01004520.1/~~gb/GEZJ01004520.1/.p1  ORF type:complete len:578 (-),score=80.42 gb/GEZJ01004520.1/:2375-3901(-)
MAGPKTVLGHDDVRAIVADCGAYNIRIGSSANDTPHAIIPSAVGLEHSKHDENISKDNLMTDVANAKPSSPYVAGDVLINAPKRFRHICPLNNPSMKNEINWDGLETCWRSCLNALHLKPDVPFLIVEPTRMWQPQERKQALERAFEGLSVPASYIARGSAMAAFASAKTSACVLDLGYINSCAIPVIDGYAMQKKSFTSKVAGRFLTDKLHDWTQQILDSRLNYDGTERRLKRLRDDDPKKVDWLRAPHEIQKEPLEWDGPERKYRVKDISSDGLLGKVTGMQRAFYRLRILDDIKVSTFRVSQTKTGENGSSKDGDKSNTSDSKSKDGKDSATKESNEKETEAKSTKEVKDGRSKDKGSTERSTEYCLPDGNVLDLEENNGMSIPDLLFRTDPDPAREMTSISDLAFQAISACDVDLRRDLYNSLVITGGTSLIPGLVERITREVSILTPQAYKLKVYAPQNYIERTCASWIGGSIISSLGTFQQAWISKAEYEEHGAMIATRKCP